MRKILFRFWVVNLLLSIVLFMVYRVFIAELQPANTSFLERFFNMMDILLNLGFSLIYLVVMIAGSFSVLLNQIEKVKRSYFLSFLTFSGIPLVCVVFFGVNILMDIYQYNVTTTPLKTPLCFSIVYLVCSILTFLMFRRIVKSTYK